MFLRSTDREKGDERPVTHGPYDRPTRNNRTVVGSMGLGPELILNGWTQGEIENRTTYQTGNSKTKSLSKVRIVIPPRPTKPLVKRGKTQIVSSRQCVRV